MSQHNRRRRDGDPHDQHASRTGAGRRQAARRPGHEVRQRFHAYRHSLRRRVLQVAGWLWLIALYGSVTLGVLFLGATMRPYRLQASTYLGPTRIYTSDGHLLGRLYEEYRLPVDLHEVPAHTVRAVLAAEDVRFFHHRGLDWRGIVRAAWVDLKARRIVQGGSTITQQLVRYELLSDRRTFRRKVREMVLAVRVERAHTKSDILERYLNTVYFGDGAYGIGAAADRYFGKRVGELTPAESAVLAAQIRAPSEGNPRDEEPATRRRQRAVLATMAREGWLTPTAYRTALAEKIAYAKRKPEVWTSPYVVETVRRKLLAQYGRELVYRSGLTVYTTVDSDLQRLGEQALERAVREGRSRGARNGALVAIDPKTGYVRALVGGVDFDRSQFNRATQAHRQPGSAFKAFVYQAAIDRGRMLNDVELDAPISIGAWTPSNYGSRYHGRVTLQQALASSLNSVAIRLVMELSPYAVIDAARAAGITSPLRPVLSIALGSFEVTPLEMAHAFATFANEGKAVEPVIIRQVRLGRQVLYVHKPIARQKVRPATAFLLTQGLSHVITDGTGRRANIGRPAAGKTGTSNDFRDAWFIGYTPDLCTSVWLGNDRHRPMAGIAGGTLPAQAWAQFMRGALRGVPPHRFAVPQGVTGVMLCSISGKLALPTCPSPQYVYLPENRVPVDQCDIHYWVTRQVCVESGKIANPTCPVTLTHRFAYNQVPTDRCPIDHRVQLIPPTPVAPVSPLTPPTPLPDATGPTRVPPEDDGTTPAQPSPPTTPSAGAAPTHRTPPTPSVRPAPPPADDRPAEGAAPPDRGTIPPESPSTGPSDREVGDESPDAPVAPEHITPRWWDTFLRWWQSPRR